MTSTALSPMRTRAPLAPPALMLLRRRGTPERSARRRLERPPVHLRRHPDRRVQMLSQGRAGGETDAAGDLVDRQVAGLQQVPGPGDALLDEPAAGAHAHLVVEAAGGGGPAPPGGRGAGGPGEG